MPRPKSVIEELPEDAQSKIISWLECYSARRVVEMIAEPAPAGFGLRTHITTLRRFYARHATASQPDEMEMAKAFVGLEVSEMGNATETLLKQWAFQIASQPQRTGSAFKALSRWSLQSREQQYRILQLELSKERLQLERARFEFNAAREALNHHSSLGEILRDHSMDDEDKIKKARERIFGKESIARIDAQEAEMASRLAEHRNRQTPHPSNGESL
jgi:hypothetical protein